MDGSGFYSCDLQGQYLTFSKVSGSFTICSFEVYEDVNLIEMEKKSAHGGSTTNEVVASSADVTAARGSFVNLLKEHPLIFTADSSPDCTDSMTSSNHEDN